MILESPFHEMYSKGGGKKRMKNRQQEHLFICSKPRTFGATQRSLFNMLQETLFVYVVYVVYGARHFYIDAKMQSEKAARFFAKCPLSL